MANTKKIRTSKIIAIGGAKGGVGKSLFAANLGVFLSLRGKKCVVIDLDLGGANLHLYLGVWSLKLRIDDFLTKKVDTINDIMETTKYGPILIGGGGGKLGSANIHFSRKLKLMRAIKNIDADCVILDLGGDTTYNILDFYLSADYGMILTTCDPASYIDAYGFIKTALLRKLTRLFGPESEYRKYRDPDLEWLIRDFIVSGPGKKGGRISDLTNLIKNEHPMGLTVVEKAINGFNPYTVVNMHNEDDEVNELVARLKKVSARMLGIDVAFAGKIPFGKEIQKSAHDLVPSVSTHPRGLFSRALLRLVSRIDLF